MFWSRLKLFFRTLAYFYSIKPSLVITKDLSHIVRTLLNIYSISVAGKFIDGTVTILGNWDSFTFREYMSTDSFFYLTLGLILWCVTSLLHKLTDYLDIIIQGEFYLKFDLDLLKKISKSNLEEVEEKEYQNLISYVPTYSSSRFIDTYNQMNLALINTMTFFGSFIMLFRFMGWSAVFVILLVLPETIMQQIRRNQIRQYADDSIGKIRFMNYIQLITTRIPDFPELRVSGVFTSLKKSFNEKGRSYYDGYYTKHFHFHSDQALFSVLDQILLTAYLIYILAVAVMNGITIGQFSALINYARTGYNAGYHLINNLFQSFNNLLYIKNFFDFVEYKSFGDIPSGEQKLPKSCPSLKFVDLSFAYPKTKEKVLENINLEIKPGEKVVFVGSSGSGKSSLIRILCGLFQITSGDYIIGGYSVRELARGELKNKIAVVFQDFVRYNFSLKKNITIGNRSKVFNNHLYEKAKKIAGVDKFMKRICVADDQSLGKYFGNGKELSPGHWQRIAIARMIYRNKQIMIMDEPFTFVDGPSKTRILDEVIDFVGKEKILIYITQDTDNLQKFDKVYYFKKGKIVEQGKATDLLKKKGHFYKEARHNR